MRVAMLELGQTGYIGQNRLYAVVPESTPCTRREFYTTPQEAGTDPMRVYYNPKTEELEVHVPAGVKAKENQATALNFGAFTSVVMILPDGTRIDGRVPDEFLQKW